MSWITVLWSMNAAACLTLAGMHLLVWLSARKEWGHLLFSFSAIAAAAAAGCELHLLRTQTVDDFVFWLKWGHFDIWVLIISIVLFARVYLKAGRLWLAWTIIALRSFSLVLSSLFPFSLSYSSITGVGHVPFLGETASVAEGTPDPWSIVSQLSSLALLVFLVDASRTVWRRGERRRAITLGGSMIFFILFAAGHTALLQAGLIRSPYLISFAFLGIILVMAYELSWDILRASYLARELHESEQQMSLAADAARLGVWVRDLARNEVWASENWRRIFGFEKAERLDFDRVLSRMHPDDRALFTYNFTKAILTEGSYEMEYRVLLPGGQMRWILSRGRIEFHASGKPKLMRGVSVDITGRRRSEEEAHNLRQELAHAGRISMLGQLATSLAHELSQPLGAILRNAEAAELFLKMEPPDLEEIQAILADIRRDDRRAGSVIDRMRSMMKRRDLKLEAIGIEDIVEEVIALVHEDAFRRGIVIDSDIFPGLPHVQGDRVQVQQVLLNLILNAMDAVAGQPEAERQVRTRAYRNSSGIVEIAVIDTGHGIAPAQLCQLFEPFFTTKPQGMGIGLALSRSIIDAHGGNISVENNPQRGATFRVTLPGLPGAVLS